MLNSVGGSVGNIKRSSFKRGGGGGEEENKEGSGDIGGGAEESRIGGGAGVARGPMLQRNLWMSLRSSGTPRGGGNDALRLRF